MGFQPYPTGRSVALSLLFVSAAWPFPPCFVQAHRTAALYFIPLTFPAPVCVVLSTYFTFMAVPRPASRSDRADHVR